MRGGPRNRLGAAVVTAALFGAGCVGATVPNETDSGGAAVTPLQQIQEQLRGRAAALMEGDVAAYLEPLTRRARRVERRIAEGAQRVPLTLFDPIIRVGHVNRAHDRVDDVRIDLVHRYEGLPDDSRFRIRLLNDYRLMDDGWVVTRSEVDVREIVPPQWVIEPVTYERSEHFLALFNPQLTTRSELDAALKLAERGRARLLRRITLEPDDVSLLELAGNTEEFGDIAVNPGGLGAAVTMFDFSALSGPSNLAVNRVMAVDLGVVLPNERRVRFERQSVKPRQVFQHELGHLALLPYESPQLPGWVAEAGAMYAANERRSTEWRDGQAQGVFDEITFAELSRSQSLYNLYEYAYANAAAGYLIERGGVERFWEFYKGFSEYEATRSANQGGRMAEANQALLKTHYDMTDDGLDLGTRRWIEKAVD